MINLLTFPEYSNPGVQFGWI